jgi:3-oxoacyl-(acyl-carrier-protein) synthase
MLVMERLHGACRGAPVLCELLGFGLTADASHICIPSIDGQAAAMVAALDDACLAPGEIEYINAHGTATRVGDTAETRAIRQAFGDAVVDKQLALKRAADPAMILNADVVF